MLTKEKPVNMRVNDKTTQIGMAKYFEYETISEAVEHLSEEKVLEKLNSQVATDEMNRVRGLARNGPGKKVLENKAMATLTAEDFAAVAGDPDKIRALIDSRMDKIREEEMAKIGASGDDGNS